MSDGILSKLLERQYLCVDKWQKSSLLGYCEDVIVRRAALVRHTRKELIVSGGSGVIQSIAVSGDGQYMATGYTSNDHQVIVYALRPKIHAISTLIGHRRSPWCLTFDPHHQNTVYSGCLGGVVKKWDFQSSSLLASFDTEEAAPITSIIPLLTPDYILVAAKHALYLLSSERLEVIWVAKCAQQIFLRLVKYLPQERKLLTIKRCYSSYSVQIADFDYSIAPDLSDISTGLILDFPLHHYHFVITKRKALLVIDNLLMTVNWTGKNKINQICRFSKEVRSIVVSPCEKYLLVVYRNPSFVPLHALEVFDLEAKCPVSVDAKHEWNIDIQPPLNCCVWMPFTNPHPLHLCMGDRAGLSLVDINSTTNITS